MSSSKATAQQSPAAYPIPRDKRKRTAFAKASENFTECNWRTGSTESRVRTLVHHLYHLAVKDRKDSINYGEVEIFVTEQMRHPAKGKLLRRICERASEEPPPAKERRQSRRHLAAV